MGGAGASHLLELCSRSANAADGMAPFTGGTLEKGNSRSVMLGGFTPLLIVLFFWSSSAPSEPKGAIGGGGTKIGKSRFFLGSFIRSVLTAFGSQSFRGARTGCIAPK